jgi:hypothetical protein
MVSCCGQVRVYSLYSSILDLLPLVTVRQSKILLGTVMAFAIVY